jgi:hypothetical protein
MKTVEWLQAPSDEHRPKDQLDVAALEKIKRGEDPNV